MTKTVCRSLFLLIVAALAGTTASAASLIGKVIEVHEGDLVTISSLNRPVKIRLMAVDSPDKDQPYFEVARQHLSDLVLNKLVLVEYSGLVESRYILGRMVLDNLDIGAQMLRDGVAWYDAKEASRLKQVERDIYLETEKLARSEHRGLWQEHAPLSPWAFRESSIIKRVAPVAAPSLKIEKPPEPSVLTNQDLMRAVGNRGGGTLRAPELSGAEYSEWKTLSPQGYDFSVLVPGTSLEQGATIPTGLGKDIDYNVAIGTYGQATYLVIWGSGPRDVRPISGVMDDIATGLTERMNEGLTLQRVNVNLKLNRTRDLKLGLLSGAEYKLSDGRANGVLRVFIKHTRTERQIYLLGALNGDDTHVGEFLNSLNFAKRKVATETRSKPEAEVTP